MISVNNQLTLIKQLDNLAILIAVCHKHVKCSFVRGNCSRETSHRCTVPLKQLFGGWAFFSVLHTHIVPIFTFGKVEKVYVMSYQKMAKISQCLKLKYKY